jgi:hypothetical protein
MENTGESVYNALNLSLEKRYSHNWSGRISYSLSKAVGTGNDQADKNTYQVEPISTSTRSVRQATSTGGTFCRLALKPRFRKPAA